MFTSEQVIFRIKFLCLYVNCSAYLHNAVKLFNCQSMYELTMYDQTFDIYFV